MNGPEGFLPKKQNFTMQVVQVLWYCPVQYCTAVPGVAASAVHAPVPGLGGGGGLQPAAAHAARQAAAVVHTRPRHNLLSLVHLPH